VRNVYPVSRYIPFAVVATAVLILAAPPPAAGAAPSAEVQGIVRSSVDGSPVTAAHIQVEGTSRGTHSDASGRFRLAGLAPGEHTLSIQRLGFAPTRLQIQIREGEELITGVEVLMSPEAVIVPGVIASVSGELQRRVETTASVSSVDGNRIREVNPTHPFEIMNQVPGVWVSPTSTEGHMTSIRQPITTNPVYLFLEDGVPTRSPGFFNHNALYEVNVPHADHIEVIRGPGTALYGSDAIGGVVDVGTRAPSSAPGVEASIERNSLGFARALVSASGTRGDDGFRLDLNLTDGDDWRDDADYDRQSATLRWDRSLPGGLSLASTATYSRVHQSDPSVITREDLETEPRVNRHPITYRSVEAFRLQSRFERRTDRSLLHVTPFARWNTLDLMPSWMLGYDPVIYESGHSSLGLMVRYNRDLYPVRGRLTVGIDTDRSPGERKEDRIRITREGGIATDWVREERIYDYRATFTGVSPYLQIQFEPIARLHLNGGLRYDAIGFDYRSRLVPLAEGPHRRPADRTVRYSNLGPSAGAALTLAPEANFFVGFRESFRSPSEGQLFRQGTSQNTIDLNPVRARSFEGGVRGEVADRVAYEVSVYRMDVRDDILGYVRPEDGLTEATNAGKSRHQGVEAGFMLRLPAGVRTDVSLTRASHRFLEWSPRESVDYAGNVIPQAPRNLASARVSAPVPGLPQARAELEWMRMGSFWMDPENAHSYEGHSLWNLRLEAPLGHGLGLSARVMNVGDRVYAERASYNAFRGEELNPGKPRAVQLGLRYRWGR
jgi:iron complex outermembrane recepter protein